MVIVGWLVVIAMTFLLGYLLAGHDTEQSLARIQALQTERDLLSERLAAQRDAQMKLERSHRIDVETRRAAQVQIMKLENDRMRLEQQVAHLRALQGAGGRGVVEVDSFVLTQLEGDQYRYRLTLSQLVPDIERTEGEVVLAIVTEADGHRATTPLAALGVGAAGRHEISFEHFQVFEGRFRLGDNGRPLDLVVEILPKDDNLLATKEVVPWRAALSDQALAPRPANQAQSARNVDRPGL
jgi:hypothetical protein